jgi:dsDNA-specific endonuclease/ATPase MutS2
MFLVLVLFLGVNAWSESRLINFSQSSRVGFVSSILSELASHSETASSNLSVESKLEFLNSVWGPHFKPSSVLQNDDLSRHLQIDSYTDLFPTKTIFGKAYGDNLLKTGATTNIAELQKRQSWIQTLSPVSKIDDSFLDLLHPTGSLDAYIKAGYLSVSKSALEDDGDRQVPFILRDSEPNWLLLEDPLRLPSFMIAKYSALLAVPAEYLTQKAIFSGFFSIQEYGCGAFIKGCTWRIGSSLLGAGSLALFGFMSQQQYQTHNRLYDFNIFLTQRLKALGIFLDTLSKIAQDPNTPEDLRPHIGAHTLSELQAILSDINGLDDTDSNFFQANLMRAMILTERVLACRPTLKRLLLNFGALDFYSSISKTGIAYVDFSNAPEPLFEAKNLRHPSLPHHNAIKSDISLGHMLLTGPNASGKSTLMRAVGINVIYLAQVLGVTTADSLTMTPFHSFYAFMETMDKTGESSSYQTELRRITDALRIHKKLAAENKRSFYLADELFSSTNAADALTGSREVLSRFSNLKQSIGIVSTHLFDLSYLAQTQPALRNFHMKAYQLNKGASAERNALKILDQELSLLRADPLVSRSLGVGRLLATSHSDNKNHAHIAHEIISPSMPDSTDLQIDSNIWADLEFSHVIRNLLPLKTVTGETWTTSFFSKAATPNTEKLLKRQDKIKRFIKNSDLLKKIREQLEIFSTFETSLLSIYDQSDFINARAIQELYPQDEDATLRATEIVLKNTDINPQTQNNILDVQSSRLRNQNRNAVGIAMQQFMRVYASVPLSLFSTYKVGSWVWKSSANPVVRAYYALLTSFGLKNVLSDPLREHHRLAELTPKLIKKLQDVSMAFETAITLSELTKEPISKQDLRLMVQFINEANALSQTNLPAALAAFRLLMDIREPFTQQLRKIGRLDFYSSTAQAMIDAPTKLTFAQFKNTGGVYLEAQDAWNPLLSKESAVTNHISMGGSQHPKAIFITGPNASGKSTFMRTVAINIYLAQTLGLAAASSFELNPFTIFNSFMKHEDRVGEESSYQSEVRNMRKILSLYEKMHSNDRAFLILDELFRSTNPDEAEVASRIILEKLGAYPQNLMLIATHLRNLTDLGANRHLENYGLKDGASFDSSALEMLRVELQEAN